MSTKARTITGEAIVKFHHLYCLQHRIPERLLRYDDPDFQLWLKTSDATERALSSPDPKIRSFSENLTRLAPDWDRRRRLGNVRMKTFLKIYVSKWFWRGLEWFEVEFVRILLERIPDQELNFLRENPEVLLRKGFFVAMELLKIDQEKSFYSKGFDLIEPNALIEFIFTEPDFNAVWNLRSVQSIRDHLFTQVTGHEHEGKLGIRKARIRGYRDGKASPRDPKLTAMARRVDVAFYENLFEKRWSELEKEISRYCST
jgi:hypothetical protein